MRCIILSISLFLFITSGVNHPLNAQGIHDRTVKQFFTQNDYYSAAALLESKAASHPTDPQVWYNLGNAHHHSRNHTAALSAYKRLMKLIEHKKGLRNKYYKAFYYNASSLMAEEKYEQARKLFFDFIRLRPNAADFRAMKRMANQQLRACDLRMKAADKTILNEYVISPLTINSGYSDFGPVWMDDNRMLFTSLKSDTLLTNDGAFYQPNRIFLTDRKKGWSDPVEFESFSHELYHTANGTFSADGSKFAFTYCQENRRQEVRCAIYLSEKRGKVWTKPVKLKYDINKTGYTNTQPAFGVRRYRRKNQEVLYFVSNRPGGRGGNDIWYSLMDKTTPPVNCGAAINTMGNEITPFYHYETNELYFSSDFHFGKGGYDIFKSYGSLKSWKRPVNLEAINSGYDDTYFSWRKYLENGTFVSNRTGSKSVSNPNCCDDIYYFDYTPASLLEGIIVKGDSSQHTLDQVQLGLADLEHLEFPDSVNWFTESDKNGHFKIEYSSGQDAFLVVKKEGYETHYLKISELKEQYKDSLTIPMFNDFHWLQKLKSVGKKEVRVLSEDILKQPLEVGAIFIMEHIYFDFDAAEIKPEAYEDLSVLQRFLENNPKVSIEIGGHTDNKGGEEHNRSLSQKRAEVIADHLISSGIAEKRLLPIGYGESKPIADNQLPDGSDNPDGRRLNRRTEIKILDSK
ncbi:OmpA family protein [Fulvivirga sp. M361]|uniref:OmpA family protein n=1 Tax=Fulvivirga sp. M361 TaxID=2594266 RepID=UPI00117A1652|nr:OmpA family protein [Fulvivirga sp. M361]TRX58388.1 OmpA family protein [Fulvivirga sp. M361]